MTPSDGPPADGSPSPAAYAASPRPSYSAPTHITAANVTRHVWGNDEAGQVADWIYASTDRIHALVFGLAPGGSFRHSPEYPTIFGADEVLTVLRGRMVLANPQTGEVHLVETGSSVAFGKDTWHHAFAHGDNELRVLELFAPPPSAGTSGAYARTKPYLTECRYEDDSTLGDWPRATSRPATMHPIGPDQISYRLAGDALIGILWSTAHLTVARLSLSPGGASSPQRRGGDEVLYALDGTLHVRSRYGDDVYVFELAADEACYLPAGSVHEYRNFDRSTATAILGVAPHFVDEQPT